MEIFVDIFRNPVHIDAAAATRGTSVGTLKLLAVFQERHTPGENGVADVHYHVAVSLSTSMRWMPYKRALRQRYQLASHWSCSHEGYWSAVRYGFIPTPKKLLTELDPTPRVWPPQHPPLFEASQEPMTAAALRRRREHSVKAASEQGKPEPRATEMDLYPIVVREGFKNTPDEPWASKRLVSYLKKHGSPAVVALAWKIRSRLDALIDDVWSWEHVDDTLAWVGETRAARFVAAGQGPCVCNGMWRHCAEWALQANAVNPGELCHALWKAARDGRHESTPVVTLMGRSGGEGKSFLLAPLRTIFGEEYIQATPQPGSFPLLGLETKRLALLEEWTFDEATLPYGTQLLWLEGKAFIVTRPQNKDYTGHLLYRGTAPVFITCKEVHMGPMIAKAQAAAALGQACEASMMLRRLKVFGFTQKLPMPPDVSVPVCGHCFVRVVSDYTAQAAP